MASYHASRTGRSRPLRMPWKPAPPPLPSWIVFDSSVAVGVPPPGLEKEWALVGCATRTAYGCGEHGQEVLDGLILFVRLVKSGEVTSALYIRTTGDALQRIRAEFGDDGFPIPMDSLELHAQGTVKTAEENHIVVTVSFELQYAGSVSYYIVYDAVDRSLSMIPCTPEPTLFPSPGTFTPLTVPRDRGDGAGGYELVVMSHKLVPPPPEGGDHSYDDILYLWTPAEAPARDGPWRVQRRCFPQQVQEPFLAEMMFSFARKMFFVDLSQGLVCCDVPSANASGIVNFDFIPLPSEIPSALRWESNQLEDSGTLDRNRTIRCLQGSIRFVCIDRSVGPHEDVSVSVWSLDLPTKQWNKVREFRAVELWKRLNFRKKGLPETPPKCPVLMPDGTLSFRLPNLCKTMQDPIEDYIFNLDVHNMVLRWYAHLDECSYRAPVILPWDFFKKVTLPVGATPRRGIFM